MQTLKLKASVLAVLSALSLAGCGTSTSTGGQGGSGANLKSGVITGFGSVFVNGVEYNSDSATITTNGVAADESKLALGMVVNLQGSVNADGKTGTATSISFSDELEGVVTATTIGATGTGMLTVMGQTVTVDASTVFESKVSAINSPTLIVAGNIVEVSGYSSGDGKIYATLVEVKKATMAPGDEIEVKGLIKMLDATAKTFSIGLQSVDYNTASLSGMTLANDLYVEVKSTQGFNSSNVLLASKVELEGDGKQGVDANEHEDVELAGVVTSVATSTEFTLNDQVVLLTSDTTFEHGTALSIAIGAKLEVEGTIDANHKLVAKQVKFDQESTIEMMASIEALDVTANTVTVLGQMIHINNSTHMKDDTSAAVRYFSLKDVAVHDAVEIDAYLDASGMLVATKFERKASVGSVVDLTGPITLVNSSSVVIAGVTVNLTNADKTALGTTSLAVAMNVKVEGSFADNVLAATKIQLED